MLVVSDGLQESVQGVPVGERCEIVLGSERMKVDRVLQQLPLENMEDIKVNGLSQGWSMKINDNQSWM